MLLANTLVDVTRKKNKSKVETQRFSHFIFSQLKMISDAHGNLMGLVEATDITNCREIWPAQVCAYLYCLTCISVHKKPRCGPWDSESEDGQLPSPGLASGFSGSLLQPLHSELSEKRTGQV